MGNLIKWSKTQILKIILCLLVLMICDFVIFNVCLLCAILSQLIRFFLWRFRVVLKGEQIPCFALFSSKKMTACYNDFSFEKTRLDLYLRTKKILTRIWLIDPLSWRINPWKFLPKVRFFYTFGRYSWKIYWKIWSGFRIHLTDKILH